MRAFYFGTAALGAIVPYSFFLPWIIEHGANLSLAAQELFSTRIGAFFGLDVLISGIAALAFMLRESSRQHIGKLWLPIALTCFVGVSCGLPLFLAMRERVRRA